MSRRRHILEIMAGIRETPVERMAKRTVARQEKINRERQRNLQLIDMIQRRQSGETGFKPMPFAKPEESK